MTTYQQIRQDLTDDLITEALFAGDGLLSDAARHLAQRLRRRVSRTELADRVGASCVLSAIREIAQRQAFNQAVEAGRKMLRQRRSEAMRASWARRRGEAADSGLPEADASDAPNARTRARHGLMFGRSPISGCAWHARGRASPARSWSSPAGGGAQITVG